MSDQGSEREQLGRIVRYAWIEWAKQQENRKDHWLTPWEELDEPIKEADRQIGEQVADYVLRDQKIYREMFEEVEQYIKNHEAYNKISHYGSRTERIGRLLHAYRQSEAEVQGKLSSFKQDVMLWMKAFALVIDSVSNASTHSEKNARLRGAIEMVESAVGKLRGDFDHFAMSYSRNPDIFRSEYPVRKYVERIRELEQKLSKLEGTEEKPKEHSSPFDEAPF